MTQPDRHTADTITDTALDQLYERIADLECQLAIDAKCMENADREWNALADASRAFKAQAEQTQTWGEQQQARANRYQERLRAQKERIKQAEAEVERLRATSQQLLTNGGKAIEERAWAQHAEERAERAEAAVGRVRALATDTRNFTPPIADDYQIGKYDLADAIRAALDEQQENP